MDHTFQADICWDLTFPNINYRIDDKNRAKVKLRYKMHSYLYSNLLSQYGYKRKTKHSMLSKFQMKL